MLSTPSYLLPSIEHYSIHSLKEMLLPNRSGAEEEDEEGVVPHPQALEAAAPALLHRSLKSDDDDDD